MSDYSQYFYINLLTGIIVLAIQGDKGDKGDRGLTTSLDGKQIPLGTFEGPPGPPGPPGKSIYVNTLQSLSALSYCCNNVFCAVIYHSKLVLIFEIIFFDFWLNIS